MSTARIRYLNDVGDKWSEKELDPSAWGHPESDPIRQIADHARSIWDATGQPKVVEICRPVFELIRRSPKAKLHVMWSSYGTILNGAGNPPSDAEIDALQINEQQITGAINRLLPIPISIKVA